MNLLRELKWMRKDRAEDSIPFTADAVWRLWPRCASFHRPH